MSEYLQVRSNGQITLPAPARRKAKLNRPHQGIEQRIPDPTLDG